MNDIPTHPDFDDPEVSIDELLAGVLRLSRDLLKAVETMTDAESRFLVDAYYLMQDSRKRARSQIMAMARDDEPHLVLDWLFVQNKTMEQQVKRALDAHTDNSEIGRWCKSIYGVGPVLAAGLLAHIDIDKAKTVGNIWTFAGLNPDSVWEKGERRPWNAGLKVLCWKAGQSFMKFSGRADCAYGHIYIERKRYEVNRNVSGGNADTARQILEVKNFGKATDALRHLSGLCTTTKGSECQIEGPHLPPAQIDARARRYAVKLFLSHMHQVWWWLKNKELCAKPFILSPTGGHKHIILPPNMPPGLQDAMTAAGYEWRDYGGWPNPNRP